MTRFYSSSRIEQCKTKRNCKSKSKSKSRKHKYKGLRSTGKKATTKLNLSPNIEDIEIDVSIDSIPDESERHEGIKGIPSSYNKAGVNKDVSPRLNQTQTIEFQFRSKPQETMNQTIMPGGVRTRIFHSNSQSLLQGDSGNNS